MVLTCRGVCVLGAVDIISMFRWEVLVLLVCLGVCVCGGD